MLQFDNVSVVKKANVYFDGKCVSHTVLFPDGSKKTLGIIFPSTLSFTPDKPEVMEIIHGNCRARVGTGDWQTYQPGESFQVAPNTTFEIETGGILQYVCHVG
jgi:purine/pyrimidine-nucleoside phosphorylase